MRVRHRPPSRILLEPASMASASGRPPPAPRVESDNFAAVSDAPAVWDDRTASLGLQDVRYAVAAEGIAKITISRPQVHNSFRPITVDELARTLAIARNDVNVGVIILTGDGPNAFCAGGDQAVRGDGGYDDGSEAAPRLQILDFQVQMRRCPKPIIAMVAGYAVGGGHILHMVADLTIAAENAVFGQTGPRVGSFDGGYGSAHMARIVGQKKAREIWFLCKFYGAHEALEMGLVNAVVPLERLERETLRWWRRMGRVALPAVAERGHLDYGCRGWPPTASQAAEDHACSEPPSEPPSAPPSRGESRLAAWVLRRGRARAPSLAPHPTCLLTLPLTAQVAPHPAEQPHRDSVSQGGAQCRRRRRGGSLQHTGRSPSTQGCSPEPPILHRVQPRERCGSSP